MPPKEAPVATKLETACPLDCPDTCSLSVTVADNEVVRDARDTLDQLVADYESKRARFEEFFAEYESQRAELIGRALDIQVAMKDLTTDEEWNSLGKTAQKVTNAILNQRLASAGE